MYNDQRVSGSLRFVVGPKSTYLARDDLIIIVYRLLSTAQFQFPVPLSTKNSLFGPLTLGLSLYLPWFMWLVGYFYRSRLSYPVATVSTWEWGGARFPQVGPLGVRLFIEEL